MRLGILTSHPIQYQAPWFRGLAKAVDLEVFFAHRQSAAEQGKAGFGVAFEWDVDLLSGYRHRFLKNVSSKPGVDHFSGCDTPEIAEIIGGKIEDRRSKIDSSPSPISHLPSPTRFDAFIVTGWYLKSYRQAVRACRRAGVPVLVRGDSQLRTPRSRLKRFAMEIRQRWLLQQFDGFLTVGKRNREYLEHYGVPPEKIFFAPHFVDNEWFAARAAEARTLPPLVAADVSPLHSSEESQLTSAATLRKELGAGEGDLVVLFVGKFQPIKRPLDLVAAVQSLTAENAKHTIKRPMHLLFVGSGELGAQLRASTNVVLDAESPISQPSTLNAQPSSHSPLPSPISHLPSPDARPRATFAGFRNQSELPRYYAAADVLVLPSESETWGLVVNEAMACGLPAIVSDAVGCAPDLIEEGKTGFTFPLSSVAALAEKLSAFAKLKRAGHDFAPALAAKMRAYSVEAAVSGTLQAVEMIRRGQRDHRTTDNETEP